MKKNISKGAVLLLVFVLVVFTPLVNNAPFAVAVEAQSDGVSLTIIHVNDRHGRMGADPYISRLAQDTVGNVLILDAGDALHGQTAAIITEGAAMVGLMNAVGYSAMVTGNHEFNYGLERLLELSVMMDFPLLAANIKTSDGATLFKPYAVFPMEGVTVGVFGLATPETVTATDPRTIAGLTFADPAETARAMVAALKAEGCDIIIALTHMGLDEFSAPANRSDTIALIPGIDVIIDGHSHTRLNNGLIVGDTLIAQTGEHGQNIGIVEISISGGVVSKTARLINVSDGLAADERIIAVIAELEAANEALTSAVVGHTPVFLDGARENVRTGETNLANLITDSMRRATGAEIAFINGGGIRSSIQAGDITMGDVLNVLPFSNILVTVELTGAELLDIFEHGISAYPEQAALLIQVSGIGFTFDPSAQPGGRVRQVTMADGGVFDVNKTYTVATVEFLAAGGDGYMQMLTGGRGVVYYGSDAEALAEHLETNPVIRAEAEGRVRALTVDIPDSGQTGDLKENPQTGDTGNTIWLLWVGGIVLLGATGTVFAKKCKR
jgi:LPXTG-motif cell wall-anchored protein